MTRARLRRENGAGPLFDSAVPKEAAGDPAPALASALPAQASPRAVGLGLVAVVALLVGAGLWGVWVTKRLVDVPAAPPIARAELSAIVGEYVQRQARSATPPDQVTAETKAFMQEIERNLQRRGSQGQVVLVGEAVLTQNVPDITAELRREVYAKVPMPKIAAAGATDVMGSMQAAMADPGLGLVGGGNGQVR